MIKSVISTIEEAKKGEELTGKLMKNPVFESKKNTE
jgi:hypothetical protein